MVEIRRLALADARQSRWKNGRGTTRELALWPDGASFERGDFDARISVAGVDESGAFSKFAGFERLLVLTGGEGLVISHGELAPRARLRNFEPYRFSGEWPTSAELVRGAVADFNVFLRRDRARAEVECLQLGVRRVRETLSCGDALCFVVRGAFTARVTGEEEPFELASGDSLRLAELRGVEELELTGRADDATALLVQLAFDR